jgi:adenylate kinase
MLRFDTGQVLNCWGSLICKISAELEADMACMDMTHLIDPQAQKNVPQGYWRGLALSVALWMVPACILIITASL